MRTVKMKYNELVPKIRKQILGLTLSTRNGVKSGMLNQIREYKNHLSVVFCIEEDKVLGWALITEDREELMIYVRRSHRRRGIGTKIVKEATKIFGVLRCHPWNSPAASFFNSVGMWTNKSGRTMVGEV